MRATVTYAVGNIMGRPVMSNTAVREDITALARMSADVTGAVEIRRPNYKRIFQGIFAARGQRSYNLSTSETPLATHLPVRRSWVTTLHKGFAKVTPARKNAGVRLALPVPTLVIVKHTVSGATREGGVYRKALRRRLLALDTRLTRARVARANRKGITVIIMGDLNSIDQIHYSHTQRWAHHVGLMHIIVCRAPHVAVRVSNRQMISPLMLHTDHPFISCIITLEREGDETQ